MSELLNVGNCCILFSVICNAVLSCCSCLLKVMDNYGVGRPSILKTAKTLLEEDGWWGFYRGFAPRFLNMSLYGTTMIVTYELISTLSFCLIILLMLQDFDTELRIFLS